MFEKIDFSALDGFNSFEDVAANLTQQDAGVLIVTGTGSSVFLSGVDAANIGADDFVF